jgi:hypothetical protein
MHKMMHLSFQKKKQPLMRKLRKMRYVLCMLCVIELMLLQLAKRKSHLPVIFATRCGTSAADFDRRPN